MTLSMGKGWSYNDVISHTHYKLFYNSTLFRSRRVENCELYYQVDRSLVGCSFILTIYKVFLQSNRSVKSTLTTLWKLYYSGMRIVIRSCHHSNTIFHVVENCIMRWQVWRPKYLYCYSFSFVVYIRSISDCLY